MQRREIIKGMAALPLLAMPSMRKLRTVPFSFGFRIKGRWW